MVPRYHAPYLSVNVFSTKVLIGDTIFTSPTGEGNAISRGYPSHEVPSFLSYFKTLSIGSTPGIEPATSRSAAKLSTDWAYPTAVREENRLCNGEAWRSLCNMNLPWTFPDARNACILYGLHLLCSRSNTKPLIKWWCQGTQISSSTFVQNVSL